MAPVQRICDGFYLFILAQTTISRSETMATTVAPPVVINGTTVVTKCSRNVTLPVPSDLFQANTTKTLIVELDESAVGNRTFCSWVIPTSDSSSSNVFRFRTTYANMSCNGHGQDFPSEVVFVSSFYTNIASHALASSCSGQGWWVPGPTNRPMFLDYSSDNVTETRVTLGSYSSFAWSDSVCNNGSVSITASGDPKEIVFPGHGLLIPSFMRCSWTFIPPQKEGLVSVSIRSNQNVAEMVDHTCNSYGDMTILDGGYPEKTYTMRFRECDDPPTFLYTSFSDWLSVTVKTSIDVAAGITIAYHAEPLEKLCPSSPFQLPSAGLFKGVNMVNGASTERDCMWQITAPSAKMVTQFHELFAEDYRENLDCHSNDTVRVDDGQTLTLCDRDKFPMWSESQTTIFHFKARTGSKGSRFVIQYIAVPKRDCQGYPVMISATMHAQEVNVTALEIHGSFADCRWLLQSNDSDLAVEATVTLRWQHYGCYSISTHRAYNGDSAHDASSRIQPYCPDDWTAVFTSSGPTMLLNFRSRKIGLSPNIRYRAIAKPPPTGSSSTRYSASTKPPPTGMATFLRPSGVLVVLAWFLSRGVV